jgi:hypothetical protein
MPSTGTLLISALFAAVSAAAANAARVSLQPRALYGETASLVCFGKDGGEAQDILVEDLQYVADYLRYIDAQHEDEGGAMWWMPPAVDCAEWTLPIDGSGSVLALAKHITPRVNSSVLFSDMADTINGRADGKNLISCGTGGGMMGVKADLTKPAYSTEEYKASKASPEGILLKIVKMPEGAV